MNPEEVSAADRTYEWTVRLLYAALIAGNLLLAWEAWSTTAAGIEFRARVAARAERVKRCQGCARRRQALQAMTGRVIWEATEIVEAAQRENGHSE